MKELSSETGFVKRERKITGKNFLLVMSFCSMQKGLSGSQLAAKFKEETGQQIALQSLFERLNEKCVEFLKASVEDLIEKVSSHNCCLNPDLLKGFTEVVIHDSSSFQIPEELKDVWPGCGGSASEAGIKCQCSYNYTSSKMAHFEIFPYNSPDGSYATKIGERATPGQLNLIDLGYFNHAFFKSMIEKGAFFISRFNHQSGIYRADTEEKIDLKKFLKQKQSTFFVLNIKMGKEKIPLRFIGYRVPKEIYETRKKEALKKASKKNKGYELSQEYLEALKWSLFITNTEESVIPAEFICEVYRLRWQIELLFKIAKSLCCISSVSSLKEESLLCFLWSKIFLITLINAVYGNLRCKIYLESGRELSHYKFAKHFQIFAHNLLSSVFIGSNEFLRLLTDLCSSAQYLLNKELRKRKTTFYILNNHVSDFVLL